MPTRTYFDYDAAEKLSGPPPVYEVKGTGTQVSLVDGEQLGDGDQFVSQGKVYTYVAAADTNSDGTGQVGFFATNGSGKVHFFSQTAVASGSVYYYETGETYTVPPVCFARETRIATPTGEIAVEDLVAGDLVSTLQDNEIVAQPVKWVGRRLINLESHRRPETVRPVRIRRGAFAENVPHRDLLVSPDHAVFVDGNLVCARQLVNGATIRMEPG